jgi:hypothetical protein
MKEPYREGVANHSGRESCGYSAPRGADRSVDSGTSGLGYGAAKSPFRTPTLLSCREGNTEHSDKRELCNGLGVVKDPEHGGKLSEREPGDLRRV